MRSGFLKKLVIFMAVLSLFSAVAAFSFAEEEPQPPDADGLSYVIFETAHGQSVLSQNSSGQFECPALYRLAVAYTAASHLSVAEKVRIPSAFAHVSEPGDYPFSSPDGLYTISSLMSACLVGNADNAAAVLAKAISDDFGTDSLNILNDLSDENGLASTYFVPGSAYTTVADIARFVNAALKNDTFRGTFCAAYVAGPDGDIITNSNELVLENTSDILGGVFSVDTSVFVRISGESGIITVVNGVGSDNYVAVQSGLLSRFASEYSKQLLVAKNSVVTSVPVSISGTRRLDYKTTESVYVYMPVGGESVLRGKAFKYEPGCSPEDITLPIKKGQLTGYVTYLLTDGTQITLPFYATEGAHFQNTFFDYIRNTVIAYKEIFIIIGVLVLLLLLSGLIKLLEKHS